MIDRSVLLGSQDFSSLAFDARDDFLALCPHFAEKPDGGFSLKQRNLLERYIEGDFHFHINVVSPCGAHVGQLTFSAVPFRNLVKVKCANSTGIEAEAGGGDSHQAKGAVDFMVAKLVQGPEGFIASHVRLEAKQVWME